MNRINLSREQICLLLVCSLAALVVMPIAVFGIPDSVDLSQHFKFARAFYESINSGNYFPGWAGNENFGYGDVGIRFYPPIEYYLLALVRIVIGNWYDAAWLTFAFWVVVGALGVYYWARCWFSVQESAVAACLYLFIPFHLHHLYITFNNYSEFAAASVTAFCFAFLTRIFRREKLSDVLGLTISFALLILLHLPSTIIGSISLFVYALILFRRKNIFTIVIKCASAVGIALAASAFYWIVVAKEMKWVNVSAEHVSSGHFSYDSGFFPFFFHDDGFQASILIVDATVALSVIFFATALIYLFYRKKNEPENEIEKNVFRTVLPLGLFAFLMVTAASRQFWQVFTPLQKVQFPSRWMSVVTMCAAIVAAAAIHYLRKGNFLKKRIWVYTCLAFSLIILLFNFIYIFHPTSFAPHSRAKFENKVEELSEKESFDYWWTIWSRSQAFEIKDKVLAENRAVEITDWQFENRSFTIAEGGATKARVATFYYPHWKATVNDAPVEIERDENGVMLVPVPAEKSVVKIVFEEPLAVKIASIVSIAAWLFIFSAGLFLAKRKISQLRSPKLYFAEEEFSC